MQLLFSLWSRITFILDRLYVRRMREIESYHDNEKIQGQRSAHLAFAAVSISNVLHNKRCTICGKKFNQKITVASDYGDFVAMDDQAHSFLHNSFAHEYCLPEDHPTRTS